MGGTVARLPFSRLSGSSAMWFCVCCIAWLLCLPFGLVTAQNCGTTSGLTLRMLIPASGQGQFDLIANGANGYINQSGNNFVTSAFGPIPTILNEMVSDLNAGTQFYDGYLAPFGPSLIKYIEKDGLMDVTQLVRESPTMEWSGVLPLFRDYNSVYNSKVYLIPVDGDVFILHYRRDLAAADNWTAPTTWEEYAQRAEYYHNKDLNGDGIPDFGTCLANDVFFGFYQFGALAASYMQTQGSSQGMWFNLKPEGMQTLFNTEAMAAALAMYMRLIRVGPQPLNQTTDQASAHSLWARGRCALYWSWPSAGTASIPQRITDPIPFVHGKMGSAVMPGSPYVLERDTGRLVSCSSGPNVCPYGKQDTKSNQLVNYSPFLCCGFIGAINAGASPAKQLAMFDFFARFSRNLEVSAPVHPFNPFRRTPDQFLVQPFVSHGWDVADATEYLAALKNSMDSPNVAISLRVEWESTVQQLIYARRAPVQNEPTVNATLVAQNLDGDVNAYLDQIGRLAVEAEYRKSLSLPLRDTRVPYELPRVATALPIFLAVLNGVVIAILLLGVHRYKYQAVMRASTVSFMFIILGGGLLVVPSIVMTVLPPSAASCTAELWLHNVGFCVVFTGLFAKNWRIASIFGDGKLQQVKIRVRELLLIVACFLAVDVLLLTLASTVAQPTGVTVNNPGDVTTTIDKCDGTGLNVFQWLIFTYHVLILIWGATLAWRVRNILLFQFNESRHMLVAVYNFALASLLLLPVTNVAFSEPTSVLILSALLKTWAFMGSLLFLFVPKFYAIFVNTELPKVVELTKSPKSGSRRHSKSDESGSGGWENLSPEDVKNYATAQSELIKTLKKKVREYEHVLVDTYEWTGTEWEDVKIPKPRGLRPSEPVDPRVHGLTPGVSAVDPQSSKMSNISDVEDSSPHHSQTNPQPRTDATPSSGTRTVGLHPRAAHSTSSTATTTTKTRNHTTGVVI